MRALIQRVQYGSVEIKEVDHFEEINKGMVILVGIKDGDTIDDCIFVADKCSGLRIFEDENDKMNLALKDINGEVLIVSQFTLYGDASRGNRPSFSDAARPEIAIPLYNMFIERMKVNLGKDKIKCGIFGAMMAVKICNDGPVTILVESKER